MPKEPLTQQQEFIPLAEKYRKNGFDYELMQRIDDVVIYKQILNTYLVAFEVFEVRKHKASVFAGINYEARETSPSNEAWGNNAFTVSNLLLAEAKMKQILENIENKKNSSLKVL